MIDAKRDTVDFDDRFISTQGSPFAGVYLPYRLAKAALDDQVFVKTKMTRKTLTWVLVDGDARIVMEEHRRTGEVRKVVVKEGGATVLRLDDGAPVQADDVRRTLASLEGFDTRPFIKAFDGAAQKVVGRGEEDHVRAGQGDDRVKTRAQDDTYVAGKGDDRIDLGGGEDVADYSELNRSIKADLRKGVVRKGARDRDDVEGVENLTGADKRDVIRGDDGANRLVGRGGDDVVKGRGGSDSLFGGEGDDRLAGGRGGDLIHGDDGDDRIQGGGGRDALHGGAGRDRLDGGAGPDVLTGGADADVFVLDPRPSNRGPDEVRDHSTAQGDRLELPGRAADYAVRVSGGSTEIRRDDGEVVAVLFGVAAPGVLEDALFG